ncbi:hypothetical protein [Roseomonas sp. HF4]|uniref:hypothetical protein n=1 Tax=Roseomonas sp. HF4 TaxID=2562313 RepID=UPI0010C033D2|nr:hypothetical protein [Roseomonas sp. HF4]
MTRLVALALAAAILAPAAALANYWVYCDSGRIAVESRDPDQMRIARGSSFCQMGPKFDYRSDAENFARRNFSSIGASCSCR